MQVEDKSWTYHTPQIKLKAFQLIKELIKTLFSPLNKRTRNFEIARSSRAMTRFIYSTTPIQLTIGKKLRSFYHSCFFHQDFEEIKYIHCPENTQLDSYQS